MIFVDDEGKETFIIEPLRDAQGGYDILFDNAYMETVQSLTEALKVYEDTHKLLQTQLRKQTWLKLYHTV